MSISQWRASVVTGDVPTQTSTSWHGNICWWFVTTPATAPTLPTMPTASVLGVQTIAPARCTDSSTIAEAGLIQHLRQERIATNQPVNTQAPVQQAHHRLDGVRAATNHYHLLNFAQPPAQIEIVVQAVKRQHAVEFASRQMSRYSHGRAASRDQ